jgi:hypothetical protein
MPIHEGHLTGYTVIFSKLYGQGTVVYTASGEEGCGKERQQDYWHYLDIIQRFFHFLAFLKIFS